MNDPAPRSPAPRPRPRPHPHGLYAAFSGFAMYGAIVLTYVLRLEELRPSLAWLPTGVAAALLIRWGTALWPWLLLGVAAASASVGQGVIAVALGALATISGPLALAMFLTRTGFHPDFGSRSDTVKFLFAAPLAMALTSSLAMLGLPALELPGEPRDPALEWLRWWFNATIGVMLITPILVSVSARSLDALRRRPIEATALAVAAGLFAVATVLLPESAQSAWLAPLGVAIVVIGALHFDVPGTGLLALVMTTAISVDSTLGPDPHVELPLALASARAWAYSMILGWLTLVIRALLSERETAVRELGDVEMRYRHRLLETQAHEQERIGREMHDSLGQELTGLSMMARGLATRAAREAPALADDARDMVETCNGAVRSAREIARGLMPPIEHDDDIALALRALLQRVPVTDGVVVEVLSAPGLRIPADTGRALYRIAQEALNNALKHSQARNIRIHLSKDMLHARLRVEDDGVGMSPREDSGAAGLGLRTMRYRAEAAGGQIRFDALGGGGTQMSCELPLLAA